MAAPGVPSDLEGERSRRTVDVTPHKPARPRLALRLGLLQWSVGGFCGIVGALTFVTPHQFVGPAYRLLRPYLPWWGLLCLLGGGALISVALLSPRRRLTLVAHWLAALPLLLLGLSAGAAGGWTGLIAYSLLALGTAIAPLLSPPADRPASTGDLFAVVVGSSAVLNGAIMLLVPEQFRSSIFDPVRPYLPLFGLGFVVGGLGVVWSQLRPSTPTPIVWGSHLLLGIAFSTFGPPVAWPNRAFTSIAYYNGFGALIALLPWLRPRLRRTDPASLRTRLALAFGLAVSVPLVITMALVTNQVEQSARTEAFSRTRVIAETLTLGISDYVDLHRAALAALVAQPGLLTADPATQQAILHAFADTYPDALTFVLYDADGQPIARGDDAPIQTPSAVRSPLFDEVRQSGATDVRVVVSPVLGQPIVALGPAAARCERRLRRGGRRHPGVDTPGGCRPARLDRAGWAGLAGGSARSADRGIGRGGASPDERRLGPAGRRGAPRARGGSGSLSYDAPDGERLAGFATVPGAAAGASSWSGPPRWRWPARRPAVTWRSGCSWW